MCPPLVSVTCVTRSHSRAEATRFCVTSRFGSTTNALTSALASDEITGLRESAVEESREGHRAKYIA